MTATLPGRTHGLGLITKSLLEDLQIPEPTFAQINLWSSLVGAAFAAPTGYIVDRFGVRLAGTIVTALLGISVWRMSFVVGEGPLLLWLTLIRGLGQSALSVISIAMIGKWFRGRIGLAMGLFTALLTFGFIGSILGMGGAISHGGWRWAWQVLAYSLLAMVPVLWIFVRNTPESLGIEADAPADSGQLSGGKTHLSRDYSLSEALATPAFWVFVLGTSAFNLVWSSITLFNETILAELGFDQKTSVEMMAFLTGTGLIANLVGGKLITRERTSWTLGIGLIALAIALACFPSIRTLNHLRLYGGAMGFVGGLVTVVHFSVWSSFYGRHHLGRIQGVAQVVSVLASALGPLMVAWTHERRGSYLPIYYTFAACIAVLAVATLIVPTPKRLTATELVKEY